MARVRGSGKIYTALADAAPELEGKTLAEAGSLPTAFTGGEGCCCDDDASSETRAAAAGAGTG